MDEREFVYKVRRNDAIAGVLRTLIRYGAVVALAIVLWLIVRELAGKVTFADIGIKLLADVRFSEVVAWGTGAAGIAYGLRERGLRRKVNATLGKRCSDLESAFDSNRTSSRLTETGDTSPEDAL